MLISSPWRIVLAIKGDNFCIENYVIVFLHVFDLYVADKISYNGVLNNVLRALFAYSSS